ncbi:MAG: hypothetical protein LBI67_03785 [Treponema sp.]|nr:hypothetical protein [Treponema sp.]
MKKSILIFLLLLFGFTAYADKWDEESTQLIFGWAFEDRDTDIQTNIAIEAILKYMEAARHQMNSYERYNPSCQIELYRKLSLSYNDDFVDVKAGGAVFIYITSRSRGDIDYHNRYIVVNFFLPEGKRFRGYKLVLYHNNYNWLEGYNGEAMELYEEDEPAFDFFISEVTKFRR